MTPEEIKNNKPKGATHYATPMGNLVYLKESYKYGFYFYKNGAWLPFCIHSPSIKPL